LLEATAVGDQAEFLSRMTRKNKTGQRRIIRSAVKHPALGAGRVEEVGRVVERHGHEQGRPRDFQVLDVTARIAGIGSLGVRRYVVLVQGWGSPRRNRLLDIKEALPSSLLPCTRAAQPKMRGNEALRVVMAQRRLTAQPPAGLDTLKIGKRWYRMRELVPDEHRSSLDRLQKDPAKLRRAVEVFGRLTGWSQVRGCTPKRKKRVAQLARWASGRGLDALLTAAVRFADRTRQDYEEYHRAYAGR
jgi:uncharacterized protein (DUF2252 family)